MNVRWIARAAFLCGVALCSGCPPIAPEIPSSDITPRSTWRASGDLRDPAKAVDGLLSTAAVSGGAYTNSFIELDLGKVCLFNRIIVEHGPDEQGFPARMAVYTSQNGETFTLQGEFPGKRHVTNVTLLSPVLARFLRLQAVSPGLRPWSVAEIQLQ